MCAQKTAPKKTDSVETLRNDAMEWLALQVARPKEQVDNPRLRRHVHGPLGSANETSLGAFFKRSGESELYITFDSMNELVKFDKLLTRSGLFENIDCVFVEKKNGKLDVTVTLDQKELTLEQAKNLLDEKEKKLLGIARNEGKRPSEFSRGMDDLATIVENSLESNDPLGGSIPEKTDEMFVTEKLEMPKKNEEAGFRGWYMSSSTGNKVPIFSNNWDKNEEERKRLWGDLVDNGECTFKVNKRILRKFEDAGFRDQFLGLIRGQDISDVKMTIKGNEITIIRGISKKDVMDRALGRRT
jgi:hypothetical protein